MRNVLRQIDENAERWLLLWFYVIIVMTISLEVLRRFVLDYSSIWGEEIARYAFIYLAWIGASIAVRERIYIRIGLLVDHQRSRVKAGFYLFAGAVTFGVAVVAFYFSLSPILNSLEFGSVTDGLRVSKVWFLSAVPLGFAMMIVRLIQTMARDFSDLRYGRKPFSGNGVFD